MRIEVSPSYPGRAQSSGLGGSVERAGCGCQQSVGAPIFLSIHPIRLEPRTLIRCFEAEGIDRR